MARRTQPWEWRRALWSSPGEAVPEKTVLISATVLAFGLILLVGALFFDARLYMPGLDPHTWVEAFAAGFLLLGAVGIRSGILRHRYEGRDRVRRRRRRPR